MRAFAYQRPTMHKILEKITRKYFNNEKITESIKESTKSLSTLTNLQLPKFTFNMNNYEFDIFC